MGLQVNCRNVLLLFSVIINLKWTKSKNILPYSSGFLIIFALPFQVCREFQRGNCTRGENECRYAHPVEAGMVDGSENSVIVCMDYVKGRCSRDKCKYFHPPAHLQARIKAAQQQQASQSAAATAAAAMVR